MSHAKRAETGPLVTIGIPAYGRPDGLSATIASMRAQTLGSLRIIVSDNASEPSLEPVVRAAADGDPRVEYHRHPKNLGMMENFHWLVQQATTPYFMWAADDDGWDPDWIETLVDLLEAHPEASLACGRFQWRTLEGEARYVDVDGLAGSRLVRMLVFFWSADARLPHSGGYGGYPIYGLFRTPFAKREWPVAMKLSSTTQHRGRWNAPDSIFIYHLLQETPIVTTRASTFYYCATRPAFSQPTPAARYVQTSKLRQHAQDIVQSVAHHVDYVKVAQPASSRLAVAISLAPKLVYTVARHEAAVLRRVARR